VAEDALDRLAAALAASRYAIALTGAGVSTASGIPDFRSPAGLWAQFDPARYATIEAWREAPDRVWEFYRARLHLLAEARPNPAHEALAALERKGVLRGLVTQNVDGLHGKAGSREVVEVHGGLDEAVCLRCGARTPRAEVERLLQRPGAPRCACGAPLKPGVVLFGELLPEAELERAVALASRSDLVLCCGSSLEVHPVAGLPETAARRGARIAVLTEGPTPYDGVADHRLHEPLHEILPELARRVPARRLTTRGSGS
jgi:NAD-dependent deacetylase